MPMKLRDIHEGKAYIANDWNIRYVRSVSRRKIHYAGFALPSGEFVGFNHCQSSGFTNWADREVTPEELGQLKLDSMKEELAKHDQFVDYIDSLLTDADIVKLARRRGLAQ